MLVLLPPSETKVQGGTGRSLVVNELRFDELADQRETLVSAVEALAEDVEASVIALKLGRTQHGEIESNRLLRTSSTMPALDRYTGVLFDALNASTLSDGARAFAGNHLVIHAALFGPIGALDLIPAYRLSHDSRIPGVSLKKLWRDAVADVLSRSDELTIDLRSEAYVALGPLRRPGRSVFVRVLAETPGGSRRALNHFNKHTKGLFTRSLMESRVQLDSRDQLLSWANDHGWRMEALPDDEVALVISEPAPARKRVSAVAEV